MIKEAWSAEAAAALYAILGEDPQATIDEVNAGIAELWRWPDNSFVVTRIEAEANGQKWLVIVAGAGVDLAGVVGHYQRIADNNAMFIRIHSTRAGMLKMLRPLGFETAETIYTYKGRKIDHGRSEQ